MVVHATRTRTRFSSAVPEVVVDVLMFRRSHLVVVAIIGERKDFCLAACTTRREYRD